LQSKSQTQIPRSAKSLKTSQESHPETITS